MEVVVSQYIKNLPSLSDVVGSSAPDSTLGRESASSSKELKDEKLVKSSLYLLLPCPLRINLASLSYDAVHQDVPLPPLAAGHQGGICHVTLCGGCHAGGGGGAGDVV